MSFFEMCMAVHALHTNKNASEPAGKTMRLYV